MTSDATVPSAIAETERLAIEGGTPLRTRSFGPRWVFDENEKAQVLEVLNRAGTSWRSGFKVREFSTLASSLYGLPHAIAVGSGTAAVHAAFGALDLEPGDEVITTPVTDVGTLIGLLQLNLVPVFADWDDKTFSLDPEDIARKVTSRTRAILAVHIFGNPCDMDAISSIARRHGIALVEDCAQAHLARYDGKLVGTFGDIACFSTGMKTLTTDQGGLVMTTSSEFAAKVRGFTSKGTRWDGKTWLPYARLGAFSPLTDLQAAVGVAQLGKLEDGTRAREMTARYLDQAFCEFEGFRLPARRAGDRCVHYIYPYHIEPAVAGVSLESFVAALKAEGIADAFGPYLKGRALHRAPLFADAKTYGSSGFPFRDESGILRIDYRSTHLPVCERMLPNIGFFHMRNSMTEEDAKDIAAGIRKVAGFFASRKVHSAPAINRAGTSSSPVLPLQVGSIPKAAFQHVPAGRLPSQPLAGARSTEKHMQAITTDATFMSLTALGANGDGKPESAAANDRAFARLSVLFQNRGGRVLIPSGRYVIKNPIVFHKLRNIHLLGEGGNAVNTGTQIVYIGSQPEGCLDLVTAVHCTFSGIEFVVDSSQALQCIRLSAAADGPTAVSSLSNAFDQCTFRKRGVSHQDFCGLRIRDSAHITFRHCWFNAGDKAIVMGAPIVHPAPTISNGQCNNISFEHCLFFGDVLAERGSAFAFNGCQFCAKTDNSGAGIDMGFGSASGVIGVSVRDCFAVDGKVSRGAFFRQGPSGRCFTMSNTRVKNYAVGVDLDGGGSAFISGNSFSLTAAGSVAIRAGQAASDVSVQANDFRETLAAGNVAVKMPIQRRMRGLLGPQLEHSLKTAVRRVAAAAKSIRHAKT